jgi:PTS system mannose-specific IID component
MQQVGLAFALEPALRWLYPAPADLRRALARYAGHSNTHPFMAPLFVGILLSLEEGAAQGALPPANLGLVRETLATSLSALGDAFFSGTLLPLWALLSVALLLAGHTGLMAGFTLALFLALLLFRAASFAAGLRYGMAVLAGLRRLNLINWVDRLKMVNAVLTALVIWRLLPGDARAFPWTGYVLGALAVLTAAWLVARLRLPRLLLWALTLGVLILMDVGLIGM